MILVLSLGMAIGIPVGINQELQAGPTPDIAAIAVMVVFFAMACVGVWFAICWKNRSTKELEEESELVSDKPSMSVDADVYRFSNGLKSAAVYLDHDAEVIHFHNCHVPRRFLAVTDEWFSCPFTDLRGAHIFRYRGESITVVTATGKALILPSGRDFNAICSVMKELVPRTQPGFSTDHPVIGMVYIFGTLAGLFLGVMLTPENASDAALGLFVLVGATAGFIASHAFVWANDRLFKTSVVQPIGFATLGGGVGLALASGLGPFLGWSTPTLVVFVVLGLAVGAYLGLRQRAREESRPLN